MREMLEKIPVNFWGSYVMLMIGIVSLCYVVYFYVSREGRDERGKRIFASASVVTFCLIIVILLLLDYLIDGDVSYTAFSFLISFLVTTIATCQAVFILLFRRLK